MYLVIDGTGYPSKTKAIEALTPYFYSIFESNRPLTDHDKRVLREILLFKPGHDWLEDYTLEFRFGNDPTVNDDMNLQYRYLKGDWIAFQIANCISHTQMKNDMHLFEYIKPQMGTYMELNGADATCYKCGRDDDLQLNHSNPSWHCLLKNFRARAKLETVELESEIENFVEYHRIVACYRFECPGCNLSLRKPRKRYATKEDYVIANRARARERYRKMKESKDEIATEPPTPSAPVYFEK